MVMHKLTVQIVRFVDSAFPGWVECELTDTEGRRHILRDKVPIFTVQDLDADSIYPTQGDIFCKVLEQFKDGNGRELARISTKKPDYIESTQGLSEFTVFADLITLVPERNL